MKLNTLAKRSQAILTLILTASGVGILAAGPAAAATFTYQDSASIILNIDSVTPVPPPPDNSNIRSIQNFGATNIGTTQRDAAFIIPFVWTFLNSSIVGLEWDNSRDGWFLEDYNQQGDELLVQLSSFSERIRLGDVADINGTAPLPRTQPCQNVLPSCLPFGPGVPPLTQDADDEVPFITLGTLNPGDTAFFDLDFTFTFEDGSSGIVPVAFGQFTAEPFTATIPEPSTGIAILVMGAIATKLKKKTATH